MQVPELLIAFANRLTFRDTVTTDDGYFIYDYGYCVGEEFQYCVYEFRCPENLPDVINWDAPPIYWEIVVLKNSEVVTVLRENCNEYAGPIPSVYGLIHEGDANFDGQTDVLLFQGAFGTQGASFYTCYLLENGTFTHAPSFSDLRNPVLDTESQVILGTWRNNACSHSYFLSYYTDGKFVTKEELVDGGYDSDGQKKYGITVLENINGEWVEQWHIPEEMEFFTVPEEFTTEGSHWALFTDRWYHYLKCARPVGGSVRIPLNVLFSK